MENRLLDTLYQALGLVRESLQHLCGILASSSSSIKANIKAYFNYFPLTVASVMIEVLDSHRGDFACTALDLYILSEGNFRSATGTLRAVQ